MIIKKCHGCPKNLVCVEVKNIRHNFHVIHFLISYNFRCHKKEKLKEEENKTQKLYYKCTA